MGEREDSDQEQDLEIGSLTGASSVTEEAVFLPPDSFIDAELPEGDIRQAAEHAALRAGLSLDAWIERSIRKCATEELGDIKLPVPAPAETDESEARRTADSETAIVPTGGISDSDLVALEKRIEQRLTEQTAQLQSLLSGTETSEKNSTTSDEKRDTGDDDTGGNDTEYLVPRTDDSEIQALLHEYFGVLLPSAQRIETVMQQLDVLLDRSVDYRDLNGFLTKLAAEAERTSSTLVPLEKAFSRLAENKLPPANNSGFQEAPSRPLPGGSGISRLFRGQE